MVNTVKFPAQGPKLTFLGWRHLGTEIIVSVARCGRQKLSCFRHSNTQKHKIFQDILVAKVRFHMLKYHVAYSLFEVEFSSNR